MDFPDDLATNVFRVGDIKEIHWTLYTKRLKDELALQNPSPIEEEESAQFLQLSEYILREGGRHVILDKDKAGVWVFSLSQALDEDIARTSGLERLESRSVGFLRPSDLVSAGNTNVSAPLLIKTARSVHSTARAVEELNIKAYGSNASSVLQPSTSEPSHTAGEAGQDHSVSAVYSNFISAVSRSLSHALGKRRGWIEAEPYACLDVRTHEDNYLDNSEQQSWISTTTKLSFDVKWLSSGILVISFCEVQLPRLRRMSEILLRDAESTGLAIGSTLLLSPFGIKCSYLGEEISTKSDAQRKSTGKLKTSILSRLSCQGIRLTREIPWIRVQIGPDSRFSVGPPVSLWPADLCFREDNYESSGSVQRSLPDGSIDPLEEAESWFLGKSARLEASRIRALEQHQNPHTVKDGEDADDEDLLSPFDISLDHGITPQDVSGIYPTPPDGVPPALLGSSNPSNQQAGVYDDEEKELQPNDETHVDYDGQENNDLFGDVDIDMFASNGLTEADFSFFDEPGMVDVELRETGQVMALDDTHETKNCSTASDGQVLTATSHGRDDIGTYPDVAGNQEDESRPQGIIPCLWHASSISAPVESTGSSSLLTGSAQVSITKNDELPDKDQSQFLRAVVGYEDVDYEALKQPNLDHRATFRDASGGQRGSFEHVFFQRSTSNLDDKYNMQGRFGFDVDELSTTKDDNHHSHLETNLTRLSVCTEESPSEGSIITDDEAEDAAVSEISDLDAAIDLSIGSKAEPSRKRKREQLHESDHRGTSSSSMPLAESPAGSPQNEMDETTSNFSIANTLEKAKGMIDLGARSHGSLELPVIKPGQAAIKVAQMIAHQAVSGLLQSKTDFCDDVDLVGHSTSNLSLQNTVSQLLTAFFPGNKRCNLKEYASLGEKNPASVSRDQLVSNQRTMKPTHLAGGFVGTGQSIFKLDSPYTRVRRNGVSTEIAASALSFWEELSLGPAHEPKDIDAFCICPRSKCIEEGVMAFLTMVKGAYQSCNLGTHDLGDFRTDLNERVVTVPMDASEPERFLQDIATTCEGLGTKLPGLGRQHGTTVVYIINPFNDRQYLPRLCDALSRLPNSYGLAAEKRRSEMQDDFVMQIVPLDLVWSPEFIVVPSPAEYRKLAFEIYNQCASSESGQSQESDFISTPAICLAKVIPKTIDFKLVSDSSAPLMQSNHCVHVSYAWDTTSKWLVAVWTDNLGVLSWRACYFLGKNEEKPWKPFYDIVKEILETSFDMLRPPNAPWQLYICKDRPMLKQESDVWLRALADCSRPSIACAILSVDAKPRLTFTYSDIQVSSSDVASGLMVTPGTTPQTNTPSPDISGLGSTPAGNINQVGTSPPNIPPGDQDSEARLVDITDETWGVLMDGALDDPSVISGMGPSLSCGYLVKRAGPRDENGVISLGVTLIHGQKPYRAVLKEVLGAYRNLGTLARVRGIVNPVKSVLPLHIAAAKKAWKAVSETMRIDPE